MPSEPTDRSDAVAPPTVFENVDWDDVSDAAVETGLSWRVQGFLVGLAVIGIGFYYEHVAGESLPLIASMKPLDWLFTVSLLAIGCFVAVPLATNREETARYWRRLRAHPTGVPSLVFILAFFVVGLVAPVLVSEPTTLVFQRANQPPLGMSIDTVHLFTPNSCLGQVTNGRCHGSLQYPLGTTRNGRDLLPFVLLGARTSLLVAVVSATLIVPTGVGAGLVAAYAGDRSDQILMQVAEVTQTVPAFVLYVLFWWWNAEYRLLVMILVFGLTSWGGLARLVRNETLQLRERPYVKAARSAGADQLDIMRQHLLPNISRSVVTNVTLQIPLLVATEAAISYIVVPAPGTGDPVTLGDASVVSWGQTVNIGTSKAGLAPSWWVALIPSLLLVLTMVSFALFGRTLGDVLDPQS